MNKLAALLIASALISPAFALDTPGSTAKEGAGKVTMKKHVAKKAKAPKAGKKAAPQSSVSSFRNTDDPWQLPS